MYHLYRCKSAAAYCTTCTINCYAAQLFATLNAADIFGRMSGGEGGQVSGGRLEDYLGSLLALAAAVSPEVPGLRLGESALCGNLSLVGFAAAY